MSTFEIFKALAATQRRIQIAILSGEERADEEREIIEKMRAALADEARAIEQTKQDAMRFP